MRNSRTVILLCNRNKRDVALGPANLPNRWCARNYLLSDYICISTGTWSLVNWCVSHRHLLTKTYRSARTTARLLAKRSHAAMLSISSCSIEEEQLVPLLSTFLSIFTCTVEGMRHGSKNLGKQPRCLKRRFLSMSPPSSRFLLLLIRGLGVHAQPNSHCHWGNSLQGLLRWANKIRPLDPLLMLN